MADGTYASHLREYTTDEHLDVSLPTGNYRFRIIPHDILDRPYEAAASAWITFKVFYRPGAVDANIVIIGLNDDEEQKRNKEPEKIKDERRFNSLGVSLGTSFVDTLFIASLHGTFSPVRNFYIEAGCDFGFVSVYDDVESYYSILLPV